MGGSECWDEDVLHHWDQLLSGLRSFDTECDTIGVLTRSARAILRFVENRGEGVRAVVDSIRVGLRPALLDHWDVNW